MLQFGLLHYSVTKQIKSRRKGPQGSSMDFVGGNHGGGGSEMVGYGRRENSSSAIHSAYKENNFAKQTGSADMLHPSVGRAIYEADIHRPNDRHDGIALAPLPNVPNS